MTPYHQELACKRTCKHLLSKLPIDIQNLVGEFYYENWRIKQLVSFLPVSTSNFYLKRNIKIVQVVIGSVFMEYVGDAKHAFSNFDKDDCSFEIFGGLWFTQLVNDTFENHSEITLYKNINWPSVIYYPLQNSIGPFKFIRFAIHPDVGTRLRH